MKTYNAYGVEMTSLQLMRFNKMTDVSGIKMNTISKAERKDVAIKFIEDWEFVNTYTDN